MKLSVVTTVYKSRAFLEEFINEMLLSINNCGILEFEIIFVNDGSPDDSLCFLLQKKDQIPEIVIIDLSRNFGHHYAMQAGLQFSKGELVFLIDNDLETPPNFFIQCFEKISKNQDIDVVYGFQTQRKGQLIERFGGKVFWWAINKFSDIPIPKNIVTERLMTRNYINNLLSLGDANLFLGGMLYWTGFNQVGLPVNRGLRFENSTYSTKKRLELMVQAITSFSAKPLQYLFFFGVLITMISLFFICYLIFKKMLLGSAIQLGWTSLIAINLLILGIITSFLGLIGIYLFKIFKQVQNRPNYIIRKVYN